MTRGNLGILQTLDHEIDRIFHRGVRHHRNPSLHPEYYMTFPNFPNTLGSPNSKHSVHTQHFEHSDHSEH